jgi:hypothetical protein
MQPQAEPPKVTDERAPYRTPKLKRYGQVASLTKGGGFISPPESTTNVPSAP